jgi:myo-inositol 2-dehydrogenase / D-chiro-inositol 1-dehydrogenase
VSGPLRVGVVGTGRIGLLHAKILAHELPEAALAMAYDVSPAAAAGLGVPVAGSAEELIGSDGVDVVAICSSTDTHVDFIVKAAEAGKPIFCEKPISLDLAEVERALAAVERAGVLFMVGFNRRFDPGHRSVRDAVAAGEIGETHLVRITSRDPEPPPLDYIHHSGGLFLDMTIHDFDIARFVTGSEIVEVYARGAVRVDPAIGEAGDIDTAALILTHADGTLTLIDNSRRAVYGFDQRVEAFGSKGMASSRNLPAHGGALRTSVGGSEPRLPTFFLERYMPSYLAEWEAFLGAVESDGPSPIPAAEGRSPLLVGLAAQRSMREAGPVAVGSP